MDKKKKLYRTLKNRALAGGLAVCMSFAGLSLTSYAGPADDVGAVSQKAGPGSGPAGTGDTAIQQVVDNSYYNQPLANPIVNPVDKYSYEQMEQDIQALAARYPGRVTVQVIGQSYDGRNIYDVIVGNPSAAKKILFQGAIHGREYIVTPLMMQQIEYLAASADGGTYLDQPMSSYLSNLAVHFVPMLNPDGVAISQLGEAGIRQDGIRQLVQAAYMMDLAEGRTTLDYATYLTRWKSNAAGVDLNHNFDADWAAITPDLTHGSYSGYKGTAPLSEPESQAINNLAQQTGFSTIINYHAMGRVLYWNTANNLAAAPSLEMAQAIAGVTGYTVLNSNGSGGFKDWMQRCANPVAGVTVEVGRSTCPVAFSEYPTIWNENKQVPALICQYVLTH